MGGPAKNFLHDCPWAKSPSKDSPRVKSPSKDSPRAKSPSRDSKRVEPVISRAQKSDVRSVQKLLNETYKTKNGKTSTVRSAAMRDYFVAKLSGEIVGMLMIKHGSRSCFEHYNQEHLSIWCVAVSKNHQRKGIATTLIQKVMKSHEDQMLPFLLVVNRKSP